MTDKYERAFPAPPSSMQVGDRITIYDGAYGMTLRDYFAAKAMTMLRSDGNAGWNACRAYEMADAMMEAREKL